MYVLPDCKWRWYASAGAGSAQPAQSVELHAQDAAYQVAGSIEQSWCIALILLISCTTTSDTLTRLVDVCMHSSHVVGSMALLAAGGAYCV